MQRTSGSVTKIDIEAVVGGSEADVRAQTTAFERASAELQALRARGDVTGARALDPLA